MLRTNRQTDRQTDSKILPTPTDRVGVGNNQRIMHPVQCSMWTYHTPLTDPSHQ